MKNLLLNCRATVLLACLSTLLLTTPGLASDAAAGEAKAKTCIVCHGRYGYSSAPNAPHLANQPEIYLTAQLRAFRAGTRQHQVMSVIAKGLSDEDIDDLAAWFSSIEIKVEAPE